MSSELPENERGKPEGRSWRWSSPNAWGALVLILLGLIFLGSNIGLFSAFRDMFNIQFNWWALFLLIPIVGIGSKLVRGLQQTGGRVTPGLRGSLVGLMVMILVFGALAFNLDWGKIWPFFLIAAGIGALLAAITNE